MFPRTCPWQTGVLSIEGWTVIIEGPDNQLLSRLHLYASPEYDILLLIYHVGYRRVFHVLNGSFSYTRHSRGAVTLAMTFLNCPTTALDEAEAPRVLG